MVYFMVNELSGKLFILYVRTGGCNGTQKSPFGTYLGIDFIVQFIFYTFTLRETKYMYI